MSVIQTPVSTSEDVRSHNLKRILRTIRNNGRCSKRSIAAETHLSFATVSNLCNALVQNGILVAASARHSSGGRIPSQLAINPQLRVLIVNMILPYQIGLTLSNYDHGIIPLPSVSLNPGDDADSKAEEIHAIVSKHMDISRLVGVCVAIAGIYNPQVQRFFNVTNPLIDYGKFRQKMPLLFGEAVYYVNESNLMAMAVAEQNPDKPDLLFMHLGEGLGTGLGLGVICMRELVTGSHGFAGEIGHMPLGTRAYPCECGHTGCVEKELTMEGFVRKYTGCHCLTKEETNALWQSFVKDVYVNKPEATAILKENGEIIGRILSVLANIFDVTAIYLGGFIDQIYSHIFPYIMNEMNDRRIINGIYSVPLYYSADSAGLLIRGGLETVFQNWLPEEALSV